MHTHNVQALEIKGPGLQYDTLFANIVHCADAGDTAFREAAENMEVLAEKMHELSKPDGTIDKMLRFSEPGQSKDRDEVLGEIIAEAEEIVADCTAAIEKVSVSFDGWCSLTKALHLALHDILGHNRGKELYVGNKIKQQQMEKEQKEEQKRKEEVIMKEKEEQMQKVREKKECLINERKVTRGGVPALIVTVSEGVTLAPAVVATGVLAFAHYVTLKADLSNTEQAQAKRDQEIRELEESRAHLEAALAQLSEDSKSIVSCFIIQMIETETDP
ncbi:hypothetical protein N7486_004743 [Penicillium sp. IBT 16267x]|nr:hypothetical protein N7486_004743 [Penicillium sp. IBT 16267x]